MLLKQDNKHSRTHLGKLDGKVHAQDTTTAHENMKKRKENQLVDLTNLDRSTSAIVCLNVVIRDATSHLTVIMQTRHKYKCKYGVIHPVDNDALINPKKMCLFFKNRH